jgi:hypothetical protein
MPVSNFNRILNASADGRTLAACGPLPDPDTDVHSVRVFAVVTQSPVCGEPQPGDTDDPIAVTCRGEVHLSKAEWQSAAAMSGGAQWSFQADTVGPLQFKQGWARGSAIALEAKANGDIETYSWSAWVWITRSP